MVNLYLIFPIEKEDSFLKSNSFLPKDEDSLVTFIKDIGKLLQNKEFSFFIDNENIHSFIQSYSTFEEEYIKSISSKLQNELKGKYRPISFDILKNESNQYFIWNTNSSYTKKILQNHAFIKIMEAVLQNENDYPFILSLDALDEAELELREGHLFIMKDTGKVEKPLFVVIPCVNSIEGIKNWIIENISIDKIIESNFFTSPEKVWEYRNIFKNLIFCDNVKKQLEDIRGDALRQILLKLQDLNAYCENVKRTGKMFNHNELKHVDNDSISNVQNNDYKVKCPDGKTRLFTLHYRTTGNPIMRLFFHHVGETNECFIGNIIHKKNIK